MKRNLFMLLIGLMAVMLFVACGSDSDGGKEQVADDASRTEESDNKDEKKADVTLPDGFPTGFPIPEDITITEVQDNSEGDQKDYTIRFDFDPEIDLESVFELYNDYTEKLGYNVLLGGEEYFADGIFQYGAHDPKSASNMFIITLKPEDGTFGSIDVKEEK